MYFTWSMSSKENHHYCSIQMPSKLLEKNPYQLREEIKQGATLAWPAIWFTISDTKKNKEW